MTKLNLEGKKRKEFMNNYIDKIKLIKIHLMLKCDKIYSNYSEAWLYQKCDFSKLKPNFEWFTISLAIRFEICGRKLFFNTLKSYDVMDRLIKLFFIHLCELHKSRPNQI